MAEISTTSSKPFSRHSSKSYKSFLRNCYPNKHSKKHLPELHIYHPSMDRREEKRDEAEALNISFPSSVDKNNGDRYDDLETSFVKCSDKNFFGSSTSLLSRNSTRRSKTPTPLSPSTASPPTSLPRSLSHDNIASSDNRFPSSRLFSRKLSWKSNTPIMFSRSNGDFRPPPMEMVLECTLEELCFGLVKKVLITRDVATNIGLLFEEEELLTVQVKPGWSKGMKVIFEGKIDKISGFYSANVTFTIAEKRHPVFRREGDDLELIVELPLVKALTGCTITIPLLGGGTMALRLDDEVAFPGCVKHIAGQGMALAEGQGKRGNLRLVFLIEFPWNLTNEQRAHASSILSHCLYES